MRCWGPPSTTLLRRHPLFSPRDGVCPCWASSGCWPPRNGWETASAGQGGNLGFIRNVCTTNGVYLRILISLQDSLSYNAQPFLQHLRVRARSVSRKAHNKRCTSVSPNTSFVQNISQTVKTSLKTFQNCLKTVQKINSSSQLRFKVKNC